jgi:Phage capsid family
VSIPKGKPTVDFRSSGVKFESTLDSARAVQLNPREWRLEAWIAVPNRVLRSLAANAELSYTLISDLADGLARKADWAFLNAPHPEGIGARTELEVSAGTSRLEQVRSVVQEVRETEPAPEFRNPGWILDQAALDRLTREPVDDTLDKDRILELDGKDGGLLVGYPFATTPSAELRIYFAADWSDAFVGIGEPAVIVDTPTQPEVSGATVIRATMTLDFALRREDGFAWAKLSEPA